MNATPPTWPPAFSAAPSPSSTDVMSFADSVQNGISKLTVAAPALAILAVLISLIATPSGRRSQVSTYVLVGIGAAFIGLYVVQPIRPGGWNFQFLAYPFLFAKWFFIGFMAAWGCGTVKHRDQRGLASIVFVIGAIPLYLTVLQLSYVPYVFRRDRAYWERAFSPSFSPEQLKFARDRLSFVGKERVAWHLQYHPHDIAAPILSELHSLGFNVLHARNTPHEIRAEAIAATEAKLANETARWQKSKIVAPLIALASNPTLDDTMFQALARIGDDKVISALVSNESNTDTRLQLLRDIVETRVADAAPNNDNDRRDIERLREQLAHLDRWRQFKNTGEWKRK